MLRMLKYRNPIRQSETTGPLCAFLNFFLDSFLAKALGYGFCLSSTELLTGKQKFTTSELVRRV